MIKKTEEHPDIVEFLCDAKDKAGKKLFDDLDIIGILHNTTWLIKNKPEILKQAVSQNINTIAKSDKRGAAVFFLPGMPSMEYCKTGSDVTTNYDRWRELSERGK